jgi:hypothetical protein
LFLNALPLRIGTISPETVPERMAERRSATVISSSPTYFSRMFSSKLESTSMSWWRYSSAWACSSVGISTTSHLAPSSSSCQTSASIVTRSMRPL